VTDRAGQIELANMSLGVTGTSSSFRTAIKKSVAAGIVYVVAAGNDGKDVYGSDGVFGTDDNFIPAAYPEVAAISAMADSDGQPGGLGSSTSYGSDDSFASLSNFSRTVIADNPVISPGAAIDLLMPGISIYSTNMGGGYTTKSGTSMASPHAAGLAALYITVNGRATDAAGVYAIRQALIDSGVVQNSDRGLAHLNDPDANWENIGWAGTELSISGYVVELDDNTPVQDVLIATDDINAMTDANGYYELLVDYGWSGVVTPQKDGYVFEPNSKTYTTVLEDRTGQDYTAYNIYDLDCDGLIGYGDVAVIARVFSVISTRMKL